MVWYPAGAVLTVIGKVSKVDQDCECCILGISLCQVVIK